jgi:tetratricopeptide (TPR) repeat protein
MNDGQCSVLAVNAQSPLCGNDLDRMYEELLLLPEEDPSKIPRLKELNDTFFRLWDNAADVETAISTLTKALELAPDIHKPIILSNLGYVVAQRSAYGGDPSDLQKGVEICEDALRLTPVGHPDRPFALNNVGNLFAVRMGLDSAIKAYDEAAKIIPVDHQGKSLILCNLGGIFQQRFECSGDIADLNKAIEVLQEATQFILDDHREHLVVHYYLGSALLRRFRVFGATSDIEDAISTGEIAVKCTPDDSPRKAHYLHSLAEMHAHRFDRLKRSTDIDKAIDIYENLLQQDTCKGVARTPFLTDLCISYVHRFEFGNDVKDIDKAIAVNTEAVQVAPPEHPIHVVLQSQRCRAYGNRYKSCRDPIDVENAILAGEEVLRRLEDNDGQRPIHLTNIANSYLSRYEYVHDAQDIDKAIVHYKDAARCATGSALERFRAALKWVDCVAKVQGASSLEAYACALGLLPQVAWHGLPMAERHRELTNVGSIVRDAGAAAIASGEYRKAVEWLEQGRSIVWGQVLDLRVPIAEIREKDEDLAGDLERVTALLERANAETDTGRRKSSQGGLALADQWKILVDRVRQLDGFEDFLLPKTVSQLRAAARSGPIVIINVHNVRCDALILRHDEDNVAHVPLDRFSIEQAQNIQSRLEKLLTGSGRRVRDERATVWVNHKRNSDQQFRDILSELWTHVVKPILDSLAYPVSSVHSCI